MVTVRCRGRIGSQAVDRIAIRAPCLATSPERPVSLVKLPRGGGRGLLAPDALIAARLAVCADCPHHRPASDRCGMMGCGCPLTLQARRPWTSCPAGRWPATAPPSL